MTAPAPALSALLRSTAARLDEAGVPSPDHDALALIAHASGLSSSDIRRLAAMGESAPASMSAAVFDNLVAARCARVPLQHLTGLAPFRELELHVGPGVFVPRPETELVAQAAIDAVRARGDDGESRVADLCAGSGAIGLALATETSARVWAVEMSADALVYLRRNAEACAPSARARVTVVGGDARTALTECDGTMDVVVSNPPYIPPAARPKDVEVDKYDPPVALYGLGEDGLEVPRGVIAAAARLLRPGGVFVMEHGGPQGAAVRAAVTRHGGFRDIVTHQDYTDWDRFVTAVRG